MLHTASSSCGPAPHEIMATSQQSSCRFCDTSLRHSVVDLGMSPLCENFLTSDQLNQAELFYPLHALVCENCFLVQVEEYVSGREIFGGEYAYFSSYSDSWLRHAAGYVEMIVKRLGLDERSQVMEIASNDGYLLSNFVSRGIPALGIEPAANVADVAIAKGIPTRIDFFGTALAAELASDGHQPDLLLANNVLAHVPDLNDFVAGMKRLLKNTGTITIEFPHLQKLIELNQFDTIYQEHYCYFSFFTVEQVFAHHGLTLYDVEELPTHGGSLRIYARHTESDLPPTSPAVEALRQREIDAGFATLDRYTTFADQVAETKRCLLEFLFDARRRGKHVVAYGAPGKGNTLLNYCGIRQDLMDYAVDRNPYKHGKYLPGSHIPVYSPEKLAETKPEVIVILPWNLRAEIVEQLDYTRNWGAQLAVPIPRLAIC